MERNLEKKDEKTVEYRGCKVVAWTWHWEEYNPDKDKWESKKQVMCHVHMPNRPSPYNMGECHNGDKFTAVNQAVNQGKQFVDFCEERRLYKELVENYRKKREAEKKRKTEKREKQIK